MTTKPFLYGIMRPDGSPHISECCIDQEGNLLGEEAEACEGQVVPLYLSNPADPNPVIVQLVEALKAARRFVSDYHATGRPIHLSDKTFLFMELDKALAVAKAAQP